MSFVDKVAGGGGSGYGFQLSQLYIIMQNKQYLPPMTNFAFQMSENYI